MHQPPSFARVNYTTICDTGLRTLTSATYRIILSLTLELQCNYGSLQWNYGSNAPRGNEEASLHPNPLAVEVKTLRQLTEYEASRILEDHDRGEIDAIFETWAPRFDVRRLHCDWFCLGACRETRGEKPHVEVSLGSESPGAFESFRRGVEGSRPTSPRIDARIVDRRIGLGLEV